MTTAEARANTRLALRDLYNVALDARPYVYRHANPEEARKASAYVPHPDTAARLLEVLDAALVAAWEELR